MYAPPPAVAARRNRGSGLAAGGPLLAICCLGFILFLIAATIVLALIPVYLAKRGGSSISSTTPTYLLNMNTRTVLLPEGALDSTSLANVARSAENTLKIPTNSIQPQSGSVQLNKNGKRKRRQSRLHKRGAGGTELFLSLVFNKLICNQCGDLGFLESIRSFAITDSININGVPYSDTFDTSIDVIDHSYPTLVYSNSDTFELDFIINNVSIPNGPIDKKSYPTMENAVAQQMNKLSNQFVIDSAVVSGNKRRKRRGFGSMRERRANRVLTVVGHYDDKLCSICGTPAFYQLFEYTLISFLNLLVYQYNIPYYITASCYPYDITTGTTTTPISVVTAKLTG